MKQISSRNFFMTRHSAARSHCVDSKLFSKDNIVPESDAHESTIYSFCFPCPETSDPLPKGFCPTELPLQKVLRLSKNLLYLYSPTLFFDRLQSHRYRAINFFKQKKLLKKLKKKHIITEYR